MSSNGAFEVDTTAAPAASGGPHFANRAGVISWANTNATSGNDDGYSDDCTDFASRALHSGGGLPETLNWPNTANDQYWYHNSAYASHSWGGAFNNSDFFYLHGATFLSNIWQAVPGDLIWVDWDGDKWRGCTSTTDQNRIDHIGVIAKVTSANIYIDQHTNNSKDVPLFKVPNVTTWQGSAPDLSVWAAIPGY